MMKINLPAQVNTVVKQLERYGYEAYIVGGCVRDSLLKKQPNDWDVCTNATPDEIKKCFSEYKTVDTGIRYGTVTVVISDMNIEITTYRIDDDYADNRRPKQVSFTGNLKEDCKRRDFTVNAMAYNPKTGIKDYFNGIKDLKNKIIRCVGDPDKRFDEDALRILRAIRFSSVLGYKLEKETAKSIKAKSELLKNISVERITTEFNKMLLGENVKSVLLKYADVILKFIPHFPQCKEALEHTVNAIEVAPLNLSVRLAILFKYIANPSCESVTIAKDTMKTLKYDKKTVKTVVSLLSVPKLKIPVQQTDLILLLNRLGANKTFMFLDFTALDIKAKGDKNNKRLMQIEDTKQKTTRIIQDNICYSLSQLKISGDDLIQQGIKEGVLIGKILNLLLKDVIFNKVPNKKQDLLKRAMSIYSNL